MPKVWQQFRKIEAGTISAKADGRHSDLDMRINVRESKKEGLKFTTKIWNLKESTWNGVSTGDPARLRVGWLDGVKSVICFGVVSKKHTQTDGPDTEYILEGQDKSHAQTNKRRSHAWYDMQPNEIASDLAQKIGLTPARIDSAGQTIPAGKSKIWAVHTDKRVKHWLNRLVDEAQKITGEKWEWRARSGKFYFVKKSQSSQEAVKLAYENTLIDLSESSGKTDSDNGPELEFEALCEPKISKGTLVHLDTDSHSGVFRVNSAEFVSDTTTGDHLVRGTVSPAGSRFSVAYPGQSAPGDLHMR